MNQDQEARELLETVRANLRAARENGSLTKLAFVARWLGNHHAPTNSWSARLSVGDIEVVVSVFAYSHVGEGVYVQARRGTTSRLVAVADTRNTVGVKFFNPGKWFEVIEAHVPAAKVEHAVAQETAGRINLAELRAMTTLPESLR